MFAGPRHHPYIRNVQRGRSPITVPQRCTYASPSPLVNTETHSRDPPPGWRMRGVSPGFEEPTSSPTPPKFNAFDRPRFERPSIPPFSPTRGFNAFGAPRFETRPPPSPHAHGLNPSAGLKFSQPSPSPSPLRHSEFGPSVERRPSPQKLNTSPAMPFAAYSPNRAPPCDARHADIPGLGPTRASPALKPTAVHYRAAARGDQPGGVKRSRWCRVFALHRPSRGRTRFWDDMEVKEQLLGTQRRSGTWGEVAEIEKLVKAGVGSKEESKQDEIFLKEMKKLALDLAPNTYFDDYKELASNLSGDRERLERAETEMKRKSQNEQERAEREQEERRREAVKREEEERQRLKAQEMRRLFREAEARKREARAKAERERLARERAEQRQKEEQERREREERLRLKRAEEERKEAERVGQQFTLYDAKWAVLKGGDDSLALDFSQLPWPVLDITPTSSIDITYDRLKAFVFHPLRHSREGKTRRDQLKMDVLKWHPDKFDAKVLGKVIEGQRTHVVQAAGAVARILTQMLSEEIEREKQGV